jgi:DeoR/GlpR family transcriptional regulator of sugar metabolism
MLAAERHHQILEALKERGSLRTKEVASDLDVTDETIRKDFELLEHQGLLVRAKSAIAKAAAQRIQPGETIFIDASSTALTITQYLPSFHHTVITNAHDVVGALADVENIDLICTGGLLERRSRSMIGLVAERTLHRYNIHRMFFSGNGLDLERGVSEGNSRQAAFKEHVIAAAEDVCLLADDSKIGARSAFFFAQCSQLTSLVTTKKADPSILESLNNMGVEIIKA